jgi:hypothetical protein
MIIAWLYQPGSENRDLGIARSDVEDPMVIAAVPCIRRLRRVIVIFLSLKFAVGIASTTKHR